METKNIRVWQKVDISHVKDHLIITQDVIGICGKCNQLNINYKNHKTCPGCGTTFEYVTVKNDAPGDIGRILDAIRGEKISLTLIDYRDYEKASARDQLSGLFKK